MIANDVAPSVKGEVAEAISKCQFIQAAALYGSVARGDAEPHSDIDLLVVCNGSHKRQVYEETLSPIIGRFKKLSISLYTPQEIQFLEKAHSLFILHLSRESELLFDRSGILSETFVRFTPKSSYTEDFKESLDLLRPLCATVANSPNQLHRLAYIYSLFRVFGVYLLAERGVYEFSKARMATLLLDVYPEQRPTLTLLSSLRVLNANFFSGGPDEVFPNDRVGNLLDLDTAIRALCSLVGKTFEPRSTSYDLAVAEFVSGARCSSAGLKYKFRTWFLLLVYDGLNIYSKLSGLEPLCTLHESRLLELTDPDYPLAVRDAAYLTLSYLRNYALRYFLFENARIPMDQACSSLIALSERISAIERVPRNACLEP